MVEFDIKRTGFVICDMQNDFVHPEGAYARAGQKSSAIAALPPHQKTVADAARKAGAWIISTHFTLVPGKGGHPFISEHLHRKRPFLRKGDFVSGSFGQDLIEELQPADIKIEKVAFSAFYMSRLEWVLRRADLETLLFCGIVTNGGVASTVRDAHVRDFKCIVLEDGCATFSEEDHISTISSLSTIATIATCADAVAAFEG
jgi:ureidoacrylate peracid hydrolase